MMQPPWPRRQAGRALQRQRGVRAGARGGPKGTHRPRPGWPRPGAPSAAGARPRPRAAARSPDARVSWFTGVYWAPGLKSSIKAISLSRVNDICCGRHPHAGHWLLAAGSRPAVLCAAHMLERGGFQIRSLQAPVKHRSFATIFDSVRCGDAGAALLATGQQDITASAWSPHGPQQRARARWARACAGVGRRANTLSAPYSSRASLRRGMDAALSFMCSSMFSTCGAGRCK